MEAVRAIGSAGMSDNTPTILFTVIALGLLMVFCAERDAMLRRTGYGTAVIGVVGLIMFLLWG